MRLQDSNGHRLGVATDGGILSAAHAAFGGLAGVAQLEAPDCKCHLPKHCYGCFKSSDEAHEVHHEQHDHKEEGHGEEEHHAHAVAGGQGQLLHGDEEHGEHEHHEFS